MDLDLLKAELETAPYLHGFLQSEDFGNDTWLPVSAQTMFVPPKGKGGGGITLVTDEAAATVSGQIPPRPPGVFQPAKDAAEALKAAVEK